MVKIHGNYCGPNWTGGKAYAASDPRVDWSVPCVDKLDCACKNHDRDCSHPQGCSTQGDDSLIATSMWISLFGPRELKEKARAITAAITAARFTRRR